MSGEEESRWIRKKGKIANRSDVWKHLKVDKNDDKLVKCDYCPSTFNYTSSTTNFWRHLKIVHKIKGWHEAAGSPHPVPSTHASPLQPETNQADAHKPQIMTQMSIEKAFGKNQEPLKKVYARLVALDLLTFFVLANSVDIKDGLKAQGYEPFDSHTTHINAVFKEHVKAKAMHDKINYICSQHCS